MSGLIMLGLLALMVGTLIVMLFMRQGWKRTLVVFVGFLVVIEIFSSYVTKTCGPNAKDVEIMTPQAEAISDYILKNGIPESMAEIPNLPYPLENCTKATDGTNVENCYFNTNEKIFSTELDVFNSMEYSETYNDIYNEKSETGVMFGFKKQDSETWSIRKNLTPYSSKNDGICNTMRQ